MNGQAFDVHDVEISGSEQAIQRRHREVREVLVIDGIELGALDERTQVGDLDDRQPGLPDQQPQAVEESVEIRDMRQDVVGVHDVDAPRAGHEAPGHVRAEKFAEGRHPARARHLGDVGGGLDPEDRDLALLVPLQEVAIVAGDLHHAAAPIERLRRDEPLHQLARVRDHGGRARREIGIVREEPLGRHGGHQLNQRARRAKDH